MRKEVLALEQARIALCRVGRLGTARRRHLLLEATECWPRWSSCLRHSQSLQKTGEAVLFSAFFKTLDFVRPTLTIQEVVTTVRYDTLPFYDVATFLAFVGGCVASRSRQIHHQCEKV